MAPYKLYEEPIQKYRELNTIDWTPTFTRRHTPTTLFPMVFMCTSPYDNSKEIQQHQGTAILWLM